MKPEAIQKLLGEMLEPLAAIEHERWSHWQRYMHGKCIPQGSEGALLIPAELVKRWERQFNTPYAALTDKEQESDREQVRLYLPLIAAKLAATEARAVSVKASRAASAKKQSRKQAPKKRS